MAAGSSHRERLLAAAVPALEHVFGRRDLVDTEHLFAEKLELGRALARNLHAPDWRRVTGEVLKIRGERLNVVMRHRVNIPRARRHCHALRHMSHRPKRPAMPTGTPDNLLREATRHAGWSISPRLRECAHIQAGQRSVIHGVTYGMDSADSMRSYPIVNLGAPGKTRTSNPQIRSLVLYPIELRAQPRAGCIANPLSSQPRHAANLAISRITLSPITEVPTLAAPGTMMSAVRRPLASTLVQARSISRASSSISNE